MIRSGNFIKLAFFLAIMVISSTADADTCEWEWLNVSPQPNDLADIWVYSDTEKFAVGELGTIIHYDGTNWSVMKINTKLDLVGIWGFTPDNVYAISKGAMFHYDGYEWRVVPAFFSSGELKDIWGYSPSEIFICGENGSLYFFNGAKLFNQSLSPSFTFHELWGSSGTDVYVVGYSLGPKRGIIYHYDGSSWTEIIRDSTVPEFVSIWGLSPTQMLVFGWGSSHGAHLKLFNGSYFTLLEEWFGEYSDVYATSLDNIYLVGVSHIYHYNSSTWKRLYPDGAGYLRRIHGVSSSIISAVGYKGVIANRYTYNWKAEQVFPEEDLPFFEPWVSDTGDMFAAGWDGRIFRYDGTTVSYDIFPGNYWLYTSWGTSSTNVYVAGRYPYVLTGVVLHYDGTAWSEWATVPAQFFADMQGTSEDNFFVVGSSALIGSVYHYNGVTFTVETSVTNTPFQGVWCNAPDDVYISGTGAVYHYDGITYSPMVNQPPFITDDEELQKIWGSSASDIYTFTNHSTLFHYNGITWSLISGAYTGTIYNVWSTAPDNVYLSGSKGIVHYDGTAWSQDLYFNNEWINGIHGNSRYNIYAVCGNGLALRYACKEIVPHVSYLGIITLMGAFILVSGKRLLK